jgi:hypothetical protein
VCIGGPLGVWTRPPDVPATFQEDGRGVARADLFGAAGSGEPTDPAAVAERIWNSLQSVRLVRKAYRPLPYRICSVERSHDSGFFAEKVDEIVGRDTSSFHHGESAPHRRQVLA